MRSSLAAAAHGSPTRRMNSGESARRLVIAAAPNCRRSVCSSSTGTQIWPSSFGTSARPPSNGRDAGAHLLGRHDVVIDADVMPVLAALARRDIGNSRNRCARHRCAARRRGCAACAVVAEVDCCAGTTNARCRARPRAPAGNCTPRRSWRRGDGSRARASIRSRAAPASRRAGRDRPRPRRRARPSDRPAIFTSAFSGVSAGSDGMSTQSPSTSNFQP